MEDEWSSPIIIKDEYLVSAFPYNTSLQEHCLQENMAINFQFNSGHIPIVSDNDDSDDSRQTRNHLDTDNEYRMMIADSFDLSGINCLATLNDDIENYYVAGLSFIHS
ncbi:unnamed protein product [Dracunculus medinensis]|uniref:Protein kinase domain-containing protein n=1 Tax=Dracunculus medinensis TaxID=318479 RepID=A0A0N4UBP7_DRAME|nr:unnamed protein product [Dracunculus medinensis]